MEYSKGEWIADIRVGVVAVHIKDDEKFHCLSGLRDQCIYWANGYRVEKKNGDFDRWEVTPESVANASLIAAAPDMYEALKFFVERNASEYAYLDKGIGTATEVGKSFLAARKALAKAVKEDYEQKNTA